LTGREESGRRSLLIFSSFEMAPRLLNECAKMR
jgi:hypothetical protein